MKKTIKPLDLDLRVKLYELEENLYRKYGDTTDPLTDILIEEDIKAELFFDKPIRKIDDIMYGEAWKDEEKALLMYALAYIKTQSILILRLELGEYKFFKKIKCPLTHNMCLHRGFNSSFEDTGETFVQYKGKWINIPPTLEELKNYASPKYLWSKHYPH